MIYEPGVNAAPILLHNVTIKGSRRCGLARHLAPAFGTPGEGARVEGEEIARCIISPSVIALCLYRGHGNSISAQPGSKTGRMPVVPLTASPKIKFSYPVRSASDSVSAGVLLYHIPSALVRQAHYEELSGGHAPDNNHPEEER